MRQNFNIFDTLRHLAQLLLPCRARTFEKFDTNYAYRDESHHI